MNKKTFFKISGTALLLCVSVTLSVRYFPAVALAIKSGVAISAAPLVAFAVFVTIALASAVALIKFAVPEKERSLVNEKKQAVPAPTPSLLPQAPEKLIIPALQQQPGNNLTKGMETPQLETDDDAVVNGDSAEQQITFESLNSLPYPSMSPLDTEKQDQLPPAPPSSTHGEPLTDLPISAKLQTAICERRKQNTNDVYNKLTTGSPLHYFTNEEGEAYQSLPLCVGYTEQERKRIHTGRPKQRLIRSHSLTDLPIDQVNSDAEFLRERDQSNDITSIDNNYISWATEWDSESTMSLSLHQHTLSFGVPPITEDEESAHTYLRQPRVNQRVQLDEDYPGFAVTSDGTRLY